MKLMDKVLAKVGLQRIPRPKAAECRVYDFSGKPAASIIGEMRIKDSQQMQARLSRY